MGLSLEFLFHFIFKALCHRFRGAGFARNEAVGGWHNKQCENGSGQNTEKDNDAD